MLFEAVAPFDNITRKFSLLFGMATTIKPPATQAPAAPNADTQLASCICNHHSGIYSACRDYKCRPIASVLVRGSPANQVMRSYTMSTVRRLLCDAHRTIISQSRQLGRGATALDVILDHRLLIGLTDLSADGRRRSPSPRNHTIRCSADVDAYWTRQGEKGGFVGPTMGQRIEPPVSAIRFTTAWPPNLDGDEVWDSGL